MNETGNFGLRLIMVALILAANGFFAGSEVALLSLRQSRLRQRADEGNLGAQAALKLLANPERLLSVVQVGVTLASLGLGWAGEDTVFQLLAGALAPVMTPALATPLHWAAFTLSFLVISYAHVVLGEVVPKNLAIDKAERLAILVAPALLVFYRISAPFVFVIERSAASISRLLGLKATEGGGGHSAEELKYIVRTSLAMQGPHGSMVERVLELDDVYVREVMVPRDQIVSVPSDATLEQVLETMVQQQHSRLPVWEGKRENIVGILHYKDLLPVWEERRAAARAGTPARLFRVPALMRRHLVVPETKPLLQMLEEFKAGRSHLAIVVDEFGTVTGLITVEDVLEQVVGEIADEYDAPEERPATPPTELEIDGVTKIRDLELEYGIEIPADAGFETLAGFIMFRLGAIPRVGDTVDFDGRRYTVLDMQRNRIGTVRIEPLPPEPAVVG